MYGILTWACGWCGNWFWLIVGRFRIVGIPTAEEETGDTIGVDDSEETLIGVVPWGGLLQNKTMKNIYRTFNIKPSFLKIFAFNWTYSSDTIIALLITLLLVISKIAGRWTSSCQKSGSSRRRRDCGQRNRCGWNGTQMSIHMRLVDDILRLGMYLTADVDILRAIFDSNWVWISYKLI